MAHRVKNWLRWEPDEIEALRRVFPVSGLRAAVAAINAFRTDGRVRDAESVQQMAKRFGLKSGVSRNQQVRRRMATHESDPLPDVIAERSAQVRSERKV